MRRKREQEEELAALREVMAPLKTGIQRPYSLSGEVLRTRLDEAPGRSGKKMRWIAPLASVACVLIIAVGSVSAWRMGGASKSAADAAAPAEPAAAAGGMAESSEEMDAVAADMEPEVMEEDGGVPFGRRAMEKSAQDTADGGDMESTEAVMDDVEDVFADWSVEPGMENGLAAAEGTLYYTGLSDSVPVLYAAKADASGPAVRAELPEDCAVQGICAVPGGRVAVAAQAYGALEEGEPAAAMYVYRLDGEELVPEHTLLQAGDLVAVRAQGGTLSLLTACSADAVYRLDGGETGTARSMSAPYGRDGPALTVGRLSPDGEVDVWTLEGGAAQLYVAEENVYAGYVRGGETEIVRIRPDGETETVGTVPAEVESASCYHERDGVLYVIPYSGEIFAFGAE